VLLGHLPGVEYPHDGFPHPGDRFWTPADWAWIGGLLHVLMPAWHHGVAVVAHRPRKFDPGEALRLMARHGVRNVFMPPTALKMLPASGAKEPGIRLRTLATGGESLSEGLIEGGRRRFGITSGGYRIGPGEIEACLQRHPAVALAAAVGEPDPIRTEVVKAVIVLKEGHAPTPQMARELQEHVRARLAAHEYPRIVEFAKEL